MRTSSIRAACAPGARGGFDAGSGDWAAAGTAAHAPVSRRMRHKSMRFRTMRPAHGFQGTAARTVPALEPPRHAPWSARPGRSTCIPCWTPQLLKRAGSHRYREAHGARVRVQGGEAHLYSPLLTGNDLTGSKNLGTLSGTKWLPICHCRTAKVSANEWLADDGNPH